MNELHQSQAVTRPTPTCCDGRHQQQARQREQHGSGAHWDLDWNTWNLTGVCVESWLPCSVVKACAQSSAEMLGDGVRPL